MDAHPDYTTAWREYRKRRLIFWAVFLGYVPGVLILLIGIGLPISALTGIKLDYFVYSIAGAWMLAFVIACLRTGLWSRAAADATLLRAFLDQAA
jgi:hypothetical protein